jgi:hypothetical protein
MRQCGPSLFTGAILSCVFPAYFLAVNRLFLCYII